MHFSLRLQPCPSSLLSSPSLCKLIHSKAPRKSPPPFLKTNSISFIFSIPTLPKINSHIPICLMHNLKTYCFSNQIYDVPSDTSSIFWLFYLLMLPQFFKSSQFIYEHSHPLLFCLHQSNQWPGFYHREKKKKCKQREGKEREGSLSFHDNKP